MALPAPVGEGSGVGSVFYIIRPPKCNTRFRSVLAHHLLFIGVQAARPVLHPSGHRRDGQDGRFQILRQWCHLPVPADTSCSANIPLLQEGSGEVKYTRGRFRCVLQMLSGNFSQNIVRAHPHISKSRNDHGIASQEIKHFFYEQ